MAATRDGEPVPVRRRKLFWAVVILAAIAGVAAGILWTARQDAGWESTGTAFVAFTFPDTVADPYGGAQFVTQRIDTYAELGGSAEVLNAVAEDVGAATPDDIADNVTVEAVPGTVLIRVIAQDLDRDRADQLAESMMTNLNVAATAVEAGGGNGTSPIDLVAVQPPVAVPASLLMTAILAGGGGLVAGAVLGVLLGWVLGMAFTRRRPPPRPQPHRHARPRGASRPKGAAGTAAPHRHAARPSRTDHG